MFLCGCCATDGLLMMPRCAAHMPPILSLPLHLALSLPLTVPGVLPEQAATSSSPLGVARGACSLWPSNTSFLARPRQACAFGAVITVNAYASTLAVSMANAMASRKQKMWRGRADARLRVPQLAETCARVRHDQLFCPPHLILFVDLEAKRRRRRSHSTQRGNKRWKLEQLTSSSSQARQMMGRCKT